MVLCKGGGALAWKCAAPAAGDDSSGAAELRMGTLALKYIVGLRTIQKDLAVAVGPTVPTVLFSDAQALIDGTGCRTVAEVVQMDGISLCDDSVGSSLWYHRLAEIAGGGQLCGYRHQVLDWLGIRQAQGHNSWAGSARYGERREVRDGFGLAPAWPFSACCGLAQATLAPWMLF